MGKKVCRDQGSNQGPSDLQSDALPTELSRLDEIYCEKRNQNIFYMSDFLHKDMMWLGLRLGAKSGVIKN